MTTEEIDDFLTKSTILQQTISGIVDGSIDESKVDLRDYGILTVEQQAEEEEKRVMARKDLAKKRARKQKEQDEQEKKQWWEGAICRFHSHNRPTGGRPQCISADAKNEESICTLKQRYSTDYTRWSDTVYIPDDEATKEEETDKRKEVEKKQNEEFEKVNKEWCDEVKGDIKEREKYINEREEDAKSLRMKGNKLFKGQKYHEAMSKYSEALKIAPYNMYILTNMALVHQNLNCFEKSVDYCNRAIHVDPKCTKAIFLRHKAFLFLRNENNAMADLMRCVDLHPESKVFNQAYQKLSSQIQYEKLDAEVAIIEHETCYTPSATEDFANTPLVSLDQILFIVTTKSGESNHALMVKQQCQYLNKCKFLFETHGLSLSIKDVFPGTSLDPEASLFHFFVTNKLCKCQIACAYMRRSGYMNNLVDYLKLVLQIAKGVWNNKERCHALSLTTMLFKVICSDPGTRLFVANDVGLIHSMLATFFELHKPEDTEVVIALGTFISGAFNNEWETYKIISTLIAEQDNFIDNVSKRLQTVASSKYYQGNFKLVTVCADLIANVLNDSQLNRIVNLREFPMKSLLSCITNIRGAKTSNTLSLQSKMRKSIMNAILSLSATKTSWEQIDSSTIVSPILLAICMSHKSEFEITREMALIALSNLTSTSNNKSCIYMRNDVYDHNGIHIMCSIIANASESISIKHRSSGLLSNLIQSSNDKLDDRAKVQIFSEIQSLVSPEKWTNESKGNEETKSIAMTACNLIKVIIASSPEKKFFDIAGDISTWIQLLPKPSTNTKGEVDCKSVCLPPEKVKIGTAMSYASTISSFHANLLKFFILYLDANPTKVQCFYEASCIDYLVCIIANSGGNQHEIVTKNASSLLARLVKSSKCAMRRCRELRGMEILVQLGKAGRI